MVFVTDRLNKYTRKSRGCRSPNESMGQRVKLTRCVADCTYYLKPRKMNVLTLQLITFIASYSKTSGKLNITYRGLHSIQYCDLRILSGDQPNSLELSSWKSAVEIALRCKGVVMQIQPGSIKLFICRSLINDAMHAFYYCRQYL